MPIGFHLGGARISLYSPYFWQWANFANIFRQTSITGILAVGMTFVIITGGIELSVGSGLAFLGCAAALMAKSDDLPFWILIVITIGLGAVIGGVNGALVTKGRFQPFIATLAAMVTLRGLAFRITDSNIVTGPNFAAKFSGFSSSISIPLPTFLGHILGTDQFWNPVPVFAIIFLIAVAAGQILLARTRFGRQVMSVGGNEEAARLSGVNVDRTKILVYAISGVMVGLAALMFTARTSTGDPASGIGYELDAIAAAVVGGTALTGGRGSIVGTLIGALFIGVLNNSLQLNSIDRYTALALEGPIILLAVAVQRRK
jgi:ribose transport system permease protein